MSAIVRPSDDELYLLSILADPSGIDLAEFALTDNRNDDGCYRVYDYQWSWFTDESMYQIDHSGRNIGKTESIKLRCLVAPFVRPGKSMLITAPELNHLRPLTDEVEKYLLGCSLTERMMPPGKSRGIARQPHWQVRFENGTSIISRLPNIDGRGVKGQHVDQLEIDEAQDFPQAGWREIVECFNAGNDGAMWRCHGVSKGVRDDFYERTQPESGWRVHRFMGMHRPTWSNKERREKIDQYGGSRQNIDYRRNVYGDHGDVQNSVFVLSRLMNCWLPKTTIHVQTSDGTRLVPIQDVQVGDTVPNAVGVGTVTDIITSRRDTVMHLTLDGEDVYCTPEHPLFTTVGWRHADQLREGDHVLTREGVRELWRTADLEDAAAFLLQEVLGSLGTGTREDLSHLQGAVPDQPAADVLLETLRRRRQEASQPTPTAGVPVLRQGSDGQGRFPLLQPGLLECQPETIDCPADLSRLWRHVRGGSRPEVLLAQLCRESGRALAAAHRGYGACVEALRALRDAVLSGGQEGQVLFEEVREHRDAVREGAAGTTVCALPRELQAPATHTSILQEGMLVREQGQESAGSPAPLDERRARGAAARPIRALGGPGGSGRWMGAGVLAQPDGGSPRDYPHDARPGPGSAQAERRGRRTGTLPIQGDATSRPRPRRVVGVARVDRAALLERGSAEFARLSGGEDQVTVYDLTVSGHPSFLIGRAGALTHNCVDTDEGSIYNTEVYRRIKMDYERFPEGASDDERNALIDSWIELPGTHKSGYSQRVKNKEVGSPKGYTAYWGGMDVGVTNHPSEILIFGQRTGTDFLELLTRIQMHRINADDQKTVIAKVMEFYGPKLKLGIDKTGVGFMLWDELTRVPFGDRIYGFGFGEKRIVAFEDRPLTGRETMEDLALRRNVVEASTDWLRNDYVDARQFRLPYDREVLLEFQGQTYMAVKDSGDPYNGTKRVFGGGSLHSLDAAKVAIATRHIPPLEDMLAKPKVQDSVLDMFMM